MKFLAIVFIAIVMIALVGCAGNGKVVIVEKNNGYIMHHGEVLNSDLMMRFYVYEDIPIGEYRAIGFYEDPILINVSIRKVADKNMSTVIVLDGNKIVTQTNLHLDDVINLEWRLFATD